MTVYLCEMLSENNQIGKSITVIDTVQAVAKKDCSIDKPILELVYNSAMDTINYFYIPEWQRYYYKTGIIAMTGSRYQISGRTDVLESFKDDILTLKVVLDTVESGYNRYINGSEWVRNIKDKTDIVTFPSGLLNSGEYILITAGGIGGGVNS